MHKRIETSLTGYYIVQYRERYAKSWATVVDKHTSVEWANAAATDHWQVNHLHTRVMFLMPIASHKPVVVMELKSA